MSSALPGRVAAKPPSANPMRLVLIGVVVIVAFVLVRSLFAHHESGYERSARELTQALQGNDIATVDKLQNSETRLHVTRAAVGHAADVFAPLGNLASVRETATSGQTHEFDAKFAKGTVHETIEFDPDGKIVHFRYDPPTPA